MDLRGSFLSFVITVGEIGTQQPNISDQDPGLQKHSGRDCGGTDGHVGREDDEEGDSR